MVIFINGNYYQNPTLPTAVNPNIASNQVPINSNYEANIEPVNNTNSLSMEESYIENILRLNKGKKVKAYFTYPDANEWRDKVYEGIIEEAGRDHLIMSDPKTGDWYLLRMIYLDYVTFEERINYSHDYSEKTF